MSNIVGISVPKEGVFLEVGRITNYVGKKDLTDGSFETIATISADDAMLERFWKEGCDNLTYLFRKDVSLGTIAKVTDSTLIKGDVYFVEPNGEGRFIANGYENPQVEDYYKVSKSGEPTIGENYEVLLVLPENWNTSLKSSINEESKTYLINYITSKWMRFVKVGDEKMYLDDALGTLASIDNKLLSRVRPVRYRYTMEEQSNPPYNKD